MCDSSKLKGDTDKQWLLEKDNVSNREADLRDESRASYRWWLILVAGTLAFGLSGSMSFIAAIAFTQADSCVFPSLPASNILQFGAIDTVFEPDYFYTQAPSNETDKAWDDLLPNGMGFVSLDKLEATGFPTGNIRELDTYNVGRLCLSVTHQLHCLNMIRIGLYGALTGDKEQVGHAQHCIEYLRQNIICAADTTLEPIKPEDNGVDGFGNKHNCRNYSAVKEWAELYRGTDTAGQHGARGGMLE